MTDVKRPDDAPNPLAMPRALSLTQAIALNVANMVGIGPFITIPLFMREVQGPVVLIAWGLAAVLVICDGLVWSELGAALPGSGGSYHFLKQIYGPLSPRWGGLMPFLFIWQFLISGTLEMASGYLGTMNYLAYVFPGLETPADANPWLPGPRNYLSALAALVVTALLCRRIETLGKWGVWLCVGTFLAALTVIISGAVHFDASLLNTSGQQELKWANIGGLVLGFGGAMQIAVYDYLGYYNVCHLGDELRDPGRTIPKAVIRSILIVASIYFLMNVAIIGVIPWQDVAASDNVAAQFMEKLYGHKIAVAFTCLVLWTVAAGMFAITLGYSRIPYAAARQGDFFSIFAKLHPTGKYPIVSLLTIGGLTAACCFLSLDTVISAAVAVRILVQFIGQIFALHLLRKTRPDVPMPFRMRLYPLPSVIAFFGWLFVLGSSKWPVLLTALGITAAGLPAYFVWKRFAGSTSPPAAGEILN